MLASPRRNYRIEQPKQWPANGLLSFPLGRDTFHGVGEVPLGALRTLINKDVDEQGTVSRRAGSATYGVTVGGVTTGDFELVLRSGTAYLLRVYNGKLYASSDNAATWTQLPIRLYRPYPAFADNGTNGERLSGALLNPIENTGAAAGANIAAATSYDYAILAVYGGGKTTLSNTATITSANPAEQIKISFHGAFKAATYEVWRRTTTGPGTWGRLATGVTHATTGGKTLVQWTDDGNTVPDTTVVPSASNTTELVLSTTNKVDFEVATWSSDNAAFFAEGTAYCVTNGTAAQIVAPTDPSTYLEIPAGTNALGDFTSPVHTVKALIRHHAHMVSTASADAPQDVMWSRADDPFHFPALGKLTVPRARGGTCTGLAVKGKALVIALDTCLWALHGTALPPDLTDDSVWWQMLSEHGVKSARSIAKATNGWVIYLSSENNIRAVVTSEGTEDSELATIELARNIQPDIAGMADGANAYAAYTKGQYILGFPSDSKWIRLFFFEGSGAEQSGMRSGAPARIVPAYDNARPFRNIVVRKSGVILASHDSNGILRQVFTGTDDEGTAIADEIATPPLNLGNTRLIKQLQRMFLAVTKPTAASSITVSLISDLSSTVTLSTVTSTGEGYDLSTYDVSVYDPWDVQILELDTDMEGHWFVVDVSSNTTNATPDIIGIGFDAVYIHRTG